MALINWDVSAEDDALISKIVTRYFRDFDPPFTLTPAELEMDITACHANGCPLRLEELLVSSRFEFGHDVSGITDCINRETGKLEGLFSPRFSV